MALERFFLRDWEQTYIRQRWWNRWILKGYFCLVFWKNKLHFVPLSYRVCSKLYSDHKRIWLGSLPKTCPLYNQVRDLFVKCLQGFFLHESRKVLHHPFQRRPFFYSRRIWGLQKNRFTSSYAHLAAPGGAATCSTSLLKWKQQKSDHLSHACLGRRSCVYVFLNVLTVSVEKIKAEHFNISITFYNRKKPKRNRHWNIPFYIQVTIIWFIYTFPSSY